MITTTSIAHSTMKTYFTILLLLSSFLAGSSSSATTTTTTTSECPNEGDCFVGVDGCVFSEPGVKCVECDLRGWLNGTKCVYESYVFVTNSVDVVTDCPVTDYEIQCVEFASKECVESKMGVRCSECESKGFVKRNEKFKLQCECYDAKYDPLSLCETRFPTTYETFNVTTTMDRVECVPWKSERMGCYAFSSSDDDERWKYGEVDQENRPAVPDKCCSEIYGPPPGELVEIEPPFQECLTLGGPDPNEMFGLRKDSSFRTCSGHGIWNATTHSCECGDKWGLSLFPGGEKDMRGNPASTCNRCKGFWGPPPPPPSSSSSSNHPPPFCSFVWTPDESGVSSECSGHGTFVNDVCACFGNATHGWWDSKTITHVFPDGYEHTVTTCLGCRLGYGPPGDCRFLNGDTANPSASPTDVETESPTTTQYRNDSCTPCPANTLLGDVIVVSSNSLTLETFNFRSVCCDFNVTTTELIDSNTTVSISSLENDCVKDENSRYVLGWEWCEYMPECTVFTWSTGSDGYYTYRFFSDENFNYVTSTNLSGSARRCPQTKSLPRGLPRGLPVGLRTRGDERWKTHMGFVAQRTSSRRRCDGFGGATCGRRGGRE